MAAPVVVDSRGQLCPLPVLKLRKALLAQPAGGRVLLLATDRQAWRDVPAFCRETGDRLVEQRDDETTLCFLVERT
jgi:tRNA 2-thiouridine synthesizing protein A